MKIAHIVSTYPPYYGGMGQVVFETATRLSNRGHEVRVFTPQYLRGEKARQSIAETEEFVRRLPAPVRYGNAAYMPSLAEELDEFDIVHLHYPFFGTASLVSRWKEKHPDRALVMTYHMDARAGGLKGIFFKWYAEWCMPSILSAADVLITSSLDYLRASDAGKFYRTNPEKWIELPFGVDTIRFAPREKSLELFGKYKMDPTKPTALFVGGMDRAHYFKGVPILLEAVARCVKQGLPMQVLCVGDGDLRSSFEARARELDIEENVRWTGRVSHDELPMHYAMADVCVLPSTTRGEAFGMVLIEAYASGVPVIASDLPGVRTIATHAGEVFHAGNIDALTSSLTRALGGEWESGVMRARARLVAEEKYAWDPIVRELEVIYEGVVA
jgi:glycosyltransferase involved in cell wall biosynthesis